MSLHDKAYNRGGHSMHNHFIIKSLALTRPGGLVAVLTSHYTLDARNPAARREMNAYADLVGAVRLPTGAHRRAAGTDVVTDLLVFRVREPGQAPASTAWETTRLLDVDGHQLRINAHFTDHPDRVLGQLQIGRGAYNAESLFVRGPVESAPEQLATALLSITDRAHQEGLTMTPALPGERRALAAAEVGDDLWEGHITALPDGTFTTILRGTPEPLEVPRSQQPELRQLLGIRDGAKRLLAAEAATVEDTVDLDAIRGDLRARYEQYVAGHGPINRFTLRRTGRSDPETGEDRMARVAPRVMRTLRDDPFASLIAAVEIFDEGTQTATPAALLTQRVVVPRTPVLGAETIEDALAVSLETHGRVELPAIAHLLGQPEAQTRADLGELVYDDPATGQLVPAAEYLSGNVRTKLEAATAAAARDPDLTVNVAALAAVLPEDLGIADVEARMGAAWIDADTHAQFLREILRDPTLKVEHPGGAVWAVKGNTHSLEALSEWGTERMPAVAIAKATLEQRPVQVFDEVDEKRVLNPGETTAAQEKAETMQERFSEWVWEDPERTDRLLTDYNRRFNSLVLRDYTTEGERLTLPGLAKTFSPHPHQRAAVARMICEPAVGLYHEVGAGKTAEMVCGAMELRRLGMVTKPAVVVPNHMLEQFSREWLQLYPQARLLAASSEDLAGPRRRQFVARVATNDWDAVIMTRTAFERVPLSGDAQREYLAREVESLRAMLASAQGGDGLTVKRIEKMLVNTEQRIAERLDAVKDPGITFEATGIDYLIIDEAHDYKNLRTPSNIRDAAIEGSKRASDLHMKTEYLRSRHGDRVITAATATPIANSVTETHVMQRYLRPDLLREAGVEAFDTWAATFAKTVTEIEMAPTGGGNYRMNTRFARFQNVPELLRMWAVFADVKTAEDLQLPTPDLARRDDGERAPRTVVIAPSPEITAYVTSLGERAEAVRNGTVEPDVDNMLLISTHGRMAALDMRMVRPEPSSTRCKLDVAAQNIARLYQACKDRPYLDRAGGERSPVPGALQIVFCELGVPNTAKWSAYDELRDQLVALGVPRERVRFIHDAKNDLEKGRLFAAARSGQIAVLIGSTQKMGVGTNIQSRAVALHHLDCPWRPADISQREGRILRQGNQHREVGIYRYVVAGSFDAYMWQTVERKAKFIAQLMRGRLDVREIEDVGDNTLSYAEVKALASGDPLILEKAHADAELTRLARLQRAHERNQHALRRTIATTQTHVDRAARELPAVQAAIAVRTDTRGDAFQMTVDGRHASTRAQAAQLLEHWAATTLSERGTIPYGRREHPLGQVGELAGFPVDATLRKALLSVPNIELSLRGVPTAPATLALDLVRENARSLVLQLENRVADLPALAERITAQGRDATDQLTRAHDAMQKPFKHAAALADAQARAADIAAQMQARAQPPPAPDPDGAEGATIDEHAAAELRRLSRANFPSPPQPGRPSRPAATPERRPHQPQRDTDLSR